MALDEMRNTTAKLPPLTWVDPHVSMFLLFMVHALVWLVMHGRLLVFDQSTQHTQQDGGQNRRHNEATACPLTGRQWYLRCRLCP